MVSIYHYSFPGTPHALFNLGNTVTASVNDNKIRSEPIRQVSFCPPFDPSDHMNMLGTTNRKQGRECNSPDNRTHEVISCKSSLAMNSKSWQEVTRK